jgi:hypothetical protein
VAAGQRVKGEAHRDLGHRPALVRQTTPRWCPSGSITKAP